MTATVRLLILSVLFTLFATGIACASPAPSPALGINKPNPYVVVPPVRPPHGVVSDGKISNVILTPQDVWLTGTTVQIGWVWSGYVGKPVEITLEKDGRVIQQIATNWTQPSKGYIVPYGLQPGNYLVRVRSSYNPENSAGRVIRIENSWIMVDQPKGASSYMVGTAIPILWSYQGNPGPVKIELLSGQSTTPVYTISQSSPPGTAGKGQTSWLVPSGMTPGSTYLIRITSLASAVIYGETSYFTLLPLPGPTLKSLDTNALFPGGMLTVTTDERTDLASWTAVVELQNGTKFEQPVTVVSNKQFKIKAPNVYSGYDAQTRKTELKQMIMQPKSIYLRKGAALSNRLAFNILYMYPILDAIHGGAPAYSDQGIYIDGGNWDTNTIYAPAMSWAVIEVAGQSVKTNILQPNPLIPVVPVPFAPAYTLSGRLMVKVPQMFCGKPKTLQDAINASTGKIYMYGLMGPNFASNKLDIQIRKTPVKAANPYQAPLVATYSPSAPNRTIYYVGKSFFGARDCQKVLITGIKNNSQYPFDLSYKTNAGVKSATVTLSPGQSTGAFNNMDADGVWEVHNGPESGSFLGKYPSIGIDISWRIE